MGDFVNQMVPIPMETVPPRPQSVSSSTGLRGLGTQGSAFESAHRALQRQQCLFYTSCCASPRGIKYVRPARARRARRAEGKGPTQTRKRLSRCNFLIQSHEVLRAPSGSVHGCTSGCTPCPTLTPRLPAPRRQPYPLLCPQPYSRPAAGAALRGGASRS